MFLIFCPKTNFKKCIFSSLIFKRYKQSYYEVLGLEKNCSSQDIKNSYIKLSKQYHPDVSNSQQAHKKFLKINEAYNTLSKPNLRRDYDFELKYPRPIYATKAHKYEYRHNSENMYSNFYTPGKGSQNNYSEDYYGFKGIKKVPNSTIVIICLAFTIIGVTLQVLLIKYSFTFQREYIKQKSDEAEATWKDVKKNAVQNQNDLQFELLIKKFEENELQRENHKRM